MCVTVIFKQTCNRHLWQTVW